MDVVPTATQSVGSMDATNALEDGNVTPAELPLLAHTGKETEHPEPPPRWRFIASVYAYSALLALLAAGLCLIGPLHGLGPIRLIIPQGAMFAVIVALYVIADYVAVELPFRGTTHALVLFVAPLFLGLAFLAPNVLVLASVCSSVIAFAVVRRQNPMKVAYNMAAFAFATALA